MKIKIFCGINKKKLEENINNFIEDKCVINILQSQIAREDCICTTLTVLYEDGFCCDYLKTILCPVDQTEK